MPARHEQVPDPKTEEPEAALVGRFIVDGFGESNGDGIGGPPGLEVRAENGDGGGDGSENCGGSRLGERWNVDHVFVPSSRAAISAWISSSDAYIVLPDRNRPADRVLRTASAEGGDAAATILRSGDHRLIRIDRSIIKSGVPSAWQKRMLSSNVLSQVGHRFIRLLFVGSSGAYVKPPVYRRRSNLHFYNRSPRLTQVY